MKLLKNSIAYTLLLSFIGSSIHAQECMPECAYDTAGVGYEESRSSPALTPAIALGAIALVAIIAVAVQNSSHKSCHSSTSHTF